MPLGVFERKGERRKSPAAARRHGEGEEAAIRCGALAHMRKNFAAQAIDRRVIRGCQLGGHVTIETRDKIIDDARQSGPVSIGGASLGLAIKSLGVAKVGVHEAGKQHSP
jgi:hypothetical protein